MDAEQSAFLLRYIQLAVVTCPQVTPLSSPSVHTYRENFPNELTSLRLLDQSMHNLHSPLKLALVLLRSLRFARSMPASFRPTVHPLDGRGKAANDTQFTKAHEKRC